MKKSYSFLLSFLFVFVAFTMRSQQNKQIQWQKTYGGDHFEGALAAKKTSDGGYITCGYTWSNNNGDVHGTHGGGFYPTDAWIVKLDSLGDTTWTKAVGGYYQDYAYDVIQTNDGGYALAIGSQSDDGDLDTNYGGWDCFIVKLNPAGQIQWKKSYGGTDDEKPKTIFQTSDGGYFVACFSESNDVNVTGNHGYYDYWVMRLNASGNLQWQKSYGGGDDEILRYASKYNGGYYLTGTSDSDQDGDVTDVSNGTYDFLVIKIDTSGNKIWDKLMGGSGWEDPFSCYTTSDNGVVLTGESESIDGDVTGHHGSIYVYDYWTVKLNSAGTMQWQKSLGGTLNDYGRSIVQTQDGGYVIIGETESTNGDLTGSGKHGLQDLWAVKLDATGSTILWKAALGGDSLDYAFSLSENPDRSLVIGGATRSINADINTGNKGLEDLWVIKLKCNPPHRDSICMVTYDSLTRSNKILWQETNLPDYIEKVKIYREITSGVYTNIASVLVDSLSEYIDMTAGINPHVQAYKYKLSTVDSCGNESDLSAFHETVSLGASPGGGTTMVLVWNNYQGFVPNIYNVYRFTKSVPTPTLIAQLPQSGSGINIYNDYQAPVLDSVGYFIGIVPPYTCSTSKNYNESKSNTTASYFVSSISEPTLFANLTIYPNPTNGLLDISFNENSGQSMVMKIFDSTGRLIYEETLVSKGTLYSKHLDVSGQNKGVYIMQLQSDRGITKQKIIIQ